jgi:hypothetical protein
MKSRIPEWELYERLVARLISNQLSTAYCVTPNAKIVGKTSNIKRQLDVLIDSRHDSNRYERVIIDAKLRKRPIDVTHVEAFQGLMADVGATHGYLVCSSGYTKAAERRVQDSLSIRLLPLDRMENFDPSTWPHCLHSNGKSGRVFWDGYPSIDMKIAPVSSDKAELRTISYLHYVGKCDKCGHFHVRCVSCGDFFSPSYLSNDDGHQCKCRLPWFWLASIEQDEDGNPAAELHFASRYTLCTVDRRSL